MAKTIGFEAYEIIEIPFVNFNFGGHSYSEAMTLVQEGKGRWAHCHGGTLKLVPLDYELKEFERFL